MKEIKLTPAQKKEMKVIVKYFMEAVEPIEDRHLQGIVAAKILSRLGALSDRLSTPTKRGK